MLTVDRAGTRVDGARAEQGAQEGVGDGLAAGGHAGALVGLVDGRLLVGGGAGRRALGSGRRRIDRALGRGLGGVVGVLVGLGLDLLAQLGQSAR